jgi:PAS domain S-box-containing protein
MIAIKPEPPEIAHSTVLIIDDLPANLGVVVEALESYGMHVLIAQDGEEGLMRAEYVQPDVILLDIMMPTLDGLEVCRRLKSNPATAVIPVIVMTSLNDIDDKVRGFQAGAVDYITKPFQIEEVLARVETQIQRYRLQRQLEVRNEELQRYRASLEQQVAERTAELTKHNLWLREEIEERKRTTEQLELMDFALDHVRESAFLVNEKSRFFYANAEACRVTGYSRNDLLAMHVTDIDPSFPIHEWALFWAKLKQQRSILLETRLRTKTGTTVPVEISANYFEYGDTSFNLALVRDISERKAAERAFKDQALRLQTLLLTIPDPVWLKDTEGRFLACNTAFAHVYGHTVEEMIGKSDLEFHPPEMTEFFLEQDRAAIAAGGPRTNEEWITYRHEGRRALWETTKTPLFDTAGNVVGVLGVARDITERKRLEDELRAKEQYQRALLDNFPFMVWLKDTESRLLAVNKPYVEAAKGNSTEDFFGKTDLDYWPRELAEAYMHDDREVLQSGRQKAVVEKLINQGRPTWIETYKAPVVVDGKLLGTVGFARDVTEERAAQQQLRVLNYALDRVNESALLMEVGKSGFIYANKRACDQLGYTHEELTTEKSVLDIDPDWSQDQLDEFSRIINDNLDHAKEAGANFESRHRTKSGRIFPVEVVVSAFEYDGKRYSLSLSRDITDRKAAETALLNSEKRYREIFDHASDGMCLAEVTEDGRFRYLEVNSTFEGHVAMTRDHIVGQYVGSLPGIASSTQQNMLEAFNKCLEHGQFDADFETDLPRGRFTFHANMIPIRDDAGHVTRILGISRDVTERKRKELLDQTRSTMLEQLAEHRPLPQVLQGVAQYVEKLHPDILCTFMLPDETQHVLHPTLSNTLPPGFIAAIDGLPLAPGCAPCAQAVLQGSSVVADDLLAGAFSSTYLKAVAEHGLAACCSTPVLDGSAKMAGTFDAYRSNRLDFTIEHEDSFHQAIHLAAIAIERKRTEIAQEKRLEIEHRLSRLADQAPGLMFIYRIPPQGQASFPYTSPAITSLFGLDSAEVAVSDRPFFALVHPDDVPHIVEAFNISSQRQIPLHCEFRVTHPIKGELWIEAHATSNRDKDGSTVWHGFMHDITERKHAETLLLVREQEFRSLAENSPDPIARFDIHGRFMYANQHLMHVIGLPMERLVGYCPIDIMDIPPLREIQGKIESALQGHPGEMINIMESPLTHLHVHDYLRFIPEFDVIGNVTSVLVIGRDISALKETERQLQTLVENLPDHVMRLDLQGRHTYVSPAVCKNTHIPPEHFIGKTAIDIDATGDPSTDRMLLEETLLCATEGKSRQCELTFHLPAGERVFSITHVPERNDLNEVVSVLAVARDITERKRMEQALVRREREYRTLAENLPDMVVRYDQDCRRRYLNPAYERYTGIKLQEARDKTPDEIWKPMMQREEYTARLKEIMRTGKPDQILLEWTLPDGSLTSHLMHAVAEYDESGKAIGVLVIGHNISELKATERRLQESRRQLQALAARREAAREEERKRIAREMHDELGQRLTALRMDVSVIRLRFGQDNPQLMEQVKHMMSSVDSTIQVVRNVAARLRPATLDMGIVSALEWLTEEFVQRSGIDCKLDVQQEHLDLDDTQATTVFRIVQESLTNITRHAQAKHVRIALTQQPDHYLLEVSDDGVGFDPHAKKHKSFGLMGIEERTLMLGGELKIETSPGKGTRIISRIPLHLASGES